MRPGVALALCAAAQATAANAEPVWRVELIGQQEWQQWHETASDGRRLVAEDGRLGGLTSTLRWAPTEAASLALSLGVLQGVRDYRGVTNLGQAAQTRSDVEHGFVRLDAVCACRLSTADWQWQPSAAAEYWQWRRHLRDAGLARGYAERYRQGLMLVGLQGRSDSGWLAKLEVGGGTGGHNRVELPGRDAAKLPLGAARTLRATLGASLAPDWQWRLAAERLTVNAGDERAITLQGVPVQSAHQPRTSLSRFQLQLSWER